MKFQYSETNPDIRFAIVAEHLVISSDSTEMILMMGDPRGLVTELTRFVEESV